MMGEYIESATLRFELTRTQTAYVDVELNCEQLEGVSIDELDAWDWTSEAWDQVDERDWETNETSVESASVYDYDVEDDGDEEDEEEDRVEVGHSQVAPVPLTLALGHLIVDGEGDIYEVEDVEGEHLILADPTTHERVDDYGGRERWKDGAGGGFRRWYRSGEHVYSNSRGEEMTVKVVSFPLLVMTSGLRFVVHQTGTWVWADEVEDEEASA